MQTFKNLLRRLFIDEHALSESTAGTVFCLKDWAGWIVLVCLLLVLPLFVPFILAEKYRLWRDGE